MSFHRLVGLLGNFSFLFVGVAWFIWRRHMRMRAIQNQGDSETEIRFHWLVSVFALFLYGFVGNMLRQLSGKISLQIPSSVLLVIASFLSLMVTILTFRGPVVSRVKNYGKFCIFRFAFAQAIGIYGFILFLFGASWLVFGIFLAWALVLELLVAPTQGNRARFLQTRIESNAG